MMVSTPGGERESGAKGEPPLTRRFRLARAVRVLLGLGLLGLLLVALALTFLQTRAGGCSPKISA